MTDGRVTVSSREIAARFGKEHKNVLQSIQNLECSAEFNQLSFELVDFQDKKGELRPKYLITRDGFSFLAMGFTGKSAATWKERYINAFNQMEETLRKNQVPMEYEIPQNYAIFW